MQAASSLPDSGFGLQQIYPAGDRSDRAGSETSSGTGPTEPKLKEPGFEIGFLSTDRTEILYSSLKAENIHYALLSDSRLGAATAFHVAYKLDNATIAMQKKYGVDLDKTTGGALHLPGRLKSI